ncbi:MAG: hypothetical protein WDM70_03305 [Nitrosomonadales bacterium]
MKPEIPPPLHGFLLVLLTLALGLVTFMQVLDTSIANVSLPAISRRSGGKSQSGHVGHHLICRQ